MLKEKPAPVNLELYLVKTSFKTEDEIQVSSNNNLRGCFTSRHALHKRLKEVVQADGERYQMEAWTNSKE